MKIQAWFVCALALVATNAVCAESYCLEKIIPLGGGERWDYLTYDAIGKHVLVAHGDRVDVVDVEAGKVIGTVTGIDGGTHGVVMAPDGRTGVSDDGKNGRAVLFDARTFKILAQIPTAEDADGIVLDGLTHRLFEINGDSGSISVVDAEARRVSATIDLGEPLEAAVSSDDGHLYVLGVDEHEIVDVDVRTYKVSKRFVLDGCEKPHGIAFDPKGKRVFATCINQVMVVVDATSGQQIASVPIDAGSDGAVFDIARHTAISANGAGTLTVVTESAPGKFDATTVPTKRGARTIAIDQTTGRLFLTTAEFDSEQPPVTAGGRPRVTYKKGSAELLVFSPTGS